MKQDYEWVTFDCYGTLIDWENGICSAFERVARTTGNTFDRNRILTLYHRYEQEEEMIYKRYREILVRIARRMSVEMGWKVPDYNFLLDGFARWRPFDDTNPSLERLARHFKLGIISNVDNDLLTQTRRHFTVNFDLAVTAEQVVSYKPSVKHFQEARKKLGGAKWIHAAQSYVHDIQPCSKLGIDCAWVNRLKEENKDPKIKPLYNNINLIGLANWLLGED